MSENTDSQLPDLRYVRELAKVFKNYSLDEIEIETGEQRILLRRGGTATPVVATVAPAPEPARAPAVTPVAVPVEEPAAKPAPAAESGDFITSPFVGTFYTAPNPESPEFCKVGDTVSPGQTVCIVEAMKLFNEIEAEFSCMIEEILVQNGEPVEFGAKLYKVRKL